MIDLHIHTKHSDGTDTVEALLKKAKDRKLDYISITDHDNCDAYEKLSKLKVAKLFPGKIIPGIEIKCSYLKRTIEILGYKIDTSKMNQLMKEFYQDKSREILQKKYFDLLYQKCFELGLILTEKEKIIWNPQNDWASLTIYSDFKKYKENRNKVPEDMWEEFSTFSKKYCGNPNHSLYIDKSSDYPSLDQAINMIKQAGGLVFLPHLFIYKWAENKEQLIEGIIQNYKIEGIECYYNSFTDKQTKYLLELCQKRKLYKSGGSDYHGLNKENIEIGIGYGSLNIPNEIIEEWI